MPRAAPSLPTRTGGIPLAGHARARRPWQFLVVLFAALSLVLLLGTTARHHHQNALGEHDCVLCSAVAHKIDDLATVVTVAMPAMRACYWLDPVCLAVPTASLARVAPRSRGPPDRRA